MVLIGELFDGSNFNEYIGALERQGKNVSDELENKMREVNFIDLTKGEITYIDEFLKEIEISEINLLELMRDFKTNYEFLLEGIIVLLNNKLQKEGEKGRTVLIKQCELSENPAIYFVETGKAMDFFQFIVLADNIGIDKVEHNRYGIRFLGFLQEIAVFHKKPEIEIFLDEKDGFINVLRKVKSFFSEINFKVNENKLE